MERKWKEKERHKISSLAHKLSFSGKTPNTQQKEKKGVNSKILPAKQMAVKETSKEKKTKN